MEIINPVAEAYAEKYTSDPGSLLNELAAKTYAHHPKSHMLSGKTQGQLLSTISCLMQPKRILEVGTFTGYSALCLAKGLAPGGLLHTIELRKEDADTASQYFRLSVWKDQIILHLGNALEIIPNLDEVWDLAFIDADKVHYIDYYQLILPRLIRGGLIIADNVLFHGEVLTEEIKTKNAKAIQAFNDFVLTDPSVEKVCVTVRDGLMLIRKK